MLQRETAPFTVEGAGNDLDSNVTNTLPGISTRKHLARARRLQGSADLFVNREPPKAFCRCRRQRYTTVTLQIFREHAPVAPARGQFYWIPW